MEKRSVITRIAMLFLNTSTSACKRLFSSSRWLIFSLTFFWNQVIIMYWQMKENKHRDSDACYMVNTAREQSDLPPDSMNEWMTALKHILLLHGIGNPQSALRTKSLLPGNTVNIYIITKGRTQSSLVSPSSHVDETKERKPGCTYSYIITENCLTSELDTCAKCWAACFSNATSHSLWP